MASDESIRDIVREMRWLGYFNGISSDYVSNLADRIEAAHNREVAGTISIINAECNHCGDCAKFGNDCSAGDIDGAEDNRACEKFVSKEKVNLREHLAAIHSAEAADRDKAIDALFAQNTLLVNANQKLRLLLKPLVESKITALASAHGTEWGVDPQFDALYNLIDSLQFKYRHLNTETPKCFA